MTEKVRFCYFNLVDQQVTTITPSTENTLYPASNLKNKFSTNVWRATTSSANVVFDFKTVEPVDTIIVRGSLLDGFGFNGSITIEANATNEWTAPAFSTSITAGNDFNFKSLTLASAENYRFWRLSGSGAQYLELSGVFIGSAFTPARNFSRRFRFDYSDLSRKQTNQYGQSYVDEVSNRKLLRGNINLVEQADLDDYLEFLNYCGEKRPFYMIFDPAEFVVNDAERFSGVYMFRQRPQLNHVIKGVYNTALRLEEAP